MGNKYRLILNITKMKKVKTNLARSAFSLIETSVVLIFMGILAAGIIAIKGSFFDSAKANKIATANKSAPMRDMNGLTIWFDVATSEGFKDSEFTIDTNISTWKNISPDHYNDFNVTQNTAANRPLYTNDNSDNLPILNFDGTNDILSSISIPGYSFLGSNQATVILVQKYNSPNHNSLILNWTSSGTNELRISALNASGNIVFDFGSDQISVNAPNFGYGWNIVSLVKSSNTGTIRVNGSVLHSAAMNDAIDVGASDNLDIGSNLNGYLREVIIFNRALTDQEIKEVEKYLSKKWGIKLNS